MTFYLLKFRYSKLRILQTKQNNKTDDCDKTKFVLKITIFKYRYLEHLTKIIKFSRSSVLLDGKCYEINCHNLQILHNKT